jgi:4-azaleucine resistance transporter AzlC
MSTARSAFLSGVRAELPILVGVVPFGIIYGALALEAGLPVSAALAIAPIIFAGSAQFIAAQLFKDGAAWFVVVATVFVVNLRHMLYSATLQPYTARLPRRWKWLLAYLLTDEAFAVVIMKYNDDSDPTHKHWYFLGAGLALWATWQLSCLAGIVLRAQAQLDPRLGLDFAIAITFIALVVPALKDRAATAAALAAGLTALLAAGLPYNLGLMAAALAGIVTGLAVEGRRTA